MTPTPNPPALLPCPFCGGKANGDGIARYSPPLANTWWNDGSKITEAFFVNCMSCGIRNGSGLGVGYQTREKAHEHWNTRQAPAEPKVSREAEDALRMIANGHGCPMALAEDTLKRLALSNPPADGDGKPGLAGYKLFTDGMEAAAEICGSLAETTYDDSDGFEAATGCEAAIMRVVREQRREQQGALPPAPLGAGGEK